MWLWGAQSVRGVLLDVFAEELADVIGGEGFFEETDMIAQIGGDVEIARRKAGDEDSRGFGILFQCFAQDLATITIGKGHIAYDQSDLFLVENGASFAGVLCLKNFFVAESGNDRGGVFQDQQFVIDHEDAVHRFIRNHKFFRQNPPHYAFSGEGRRSIVHAQDGCRKVRR